MQKRELAFDELHQRHNFPLKDKKTMAKRCVQATSPNKKNKYFTHILLAEDWIVSVGAFCPLLKCSSLWSNGNLLIPLAAHCHLPLPLPHKDTTISVIGLATIAFGHSPNSNDALTLSVSSPDHFGSYFINVIS